MVDYVPIKVSVIKWACERIGLFYSELSVSKKFKRLAKEENGVVTLTLKQAENLAKILRYPFVYLLLDSPVTDIDKLPIQDFRSLNGEKVKPSINLKEQIEYCQNQQDWFSEYVKDCDLDTFEFNGKFTLENSPQEAGQKLKDFLKIDYKSCKNANDYLKKLKAILEEHGILVSSSKVLKNSNERLNLTDFRGFALFDENAPLIFINGNDSICAQIFTLCHELGHICLGKSGVSDVERNNNRKTEKWCNEFAANILMPKNEVSDLFKLHNEIGQFLKDATRLFYVSTNALLIRIYNLALIDQNTFEKEWTKAEEQYRDHLNCMQNSNTKSSGNYYKTVNSRISHLLLKSLVSSTSVGQTTFRDATYLLGMKSISTFDKLAMLQP